MDHSPTEDGHRDNASADERNHCGHASPRPLLPSALATFSAARGVDRGGGEDFAAAGTFHFVHFLVSAFRIIGNLSTFEYLIHKRPCFIGWRFSSRDGGSAETVDTIQAQRRRGCCPIQLCIFTFRGDETPSKLGCGTGSSAARTGSGPSAAAGRCHGFPLLQALIQSPITADSTVSICDWTVSRMEPTRTMSSTSIRRASSRVSGSGLSHNSCRAGSIHSSTAHFRAKRSR